MFNLRLCNATIIRYSLLKFGHMHLCGKGYKCFSPHSCRCNSFGCIATIRWGNACHGPHNDSLYSGSEHRQFNSPRLVKREAGFPNPRQALIGSNQLWRVNDSPYLWELPVKWGCFSLSREWITACDLFVDKWYKMQICVYSACKRLIFIFFSLEELHLSLNNFTNIAADDLPTCPSIQRLYLNENAITDWSHVNKLGKVFPNMKHLVLIGNPLETIEYDESLANIEMLNLSGTKLKDWSEIEKLRKFPCLKAVRLRKIPFLEVNKNITLKSLI